LKEDAKQLRNRYRGALLGLAAGDALGTTLEFRGPGSFNPITDMIGGGPFKLEPGQWTDDTSMALCLADSLICMHSFDPKDQMDRYCRWWRAGYLSSTTGAIFGQLGGTFYGESELPPRWIKKIAMHQFICEMADALFELSASSSHD